MPTGTGHNGAAHASPATYKAGRRNYFAETQLYDIVERKGGCHEPCIERACQRG